jgi:hypothetical protein
LIQSRSDRRAKPKKKKKTALRSRAEARRRSGLQRDHARPTRAPRWIEASSRDPSEAIARPANPVEISWAGPSAARPGDRETRPDPIEGNKRSLGPLVRMDRSPVTPHHRLALWSSAFSGFASDSLLALRDGDPLASSERSPRTWFGPSCASLQLQKKRQGKN